MGLTSIPTETSGSLGTDKFDRYPRANETDSISADEWNTAKRAIAEMAPVIGLEDGSTEGSLVAKAPVSAVKTADETRASSATLADDAELSVTVKAGTYSIRATLFGMLDSDPYGVRVGLAGTATIGYVRAWGRIYSGPDDTTAASLVGTMGQVAAYDTASAGAWSAVIEATIEVSAAGTIAVQWAQGTSNVAGLTVERGSSLVATRIG